MQMPQHLVFRLISLGMKETWTHTHAHPFSLGGAVLKVLMGM